MNCGPYNSWHSGAWHDYGTIQTNKTILVLLTLLVPSIFMTFLKNKGLFQLREEVVGSVQSVHSVHRHMRTAGSGLWPEEAVHASSSRSGPTKGRTWILRAQNEAKSVHKNHTGLHWLGVRRHRGLMATVAGHRLQIDHRTAGLYLRPRLFTVGL